MRMLAIALLTILSAAVGIVGVKAQTAPYGQHGEYPGTHHYTYPNRPHFRHLRPMTPGEMQRQYHLRANHNFRQPPLHVICVLGGTDFSNSGSFKNVGLRTVPTGSELHWTAGQWQGNFGFVNPLPPGGSVGFYIGHWTSSATTCTAKFIK